MSGSNQIFQNSHRTNNTPEDIVKFWFPEPRDVEPQAHIDLWEWRMRGGAHEEVIAKFTDLTQQAAAGSLDHWADTSVGRMVLIIILDQFARSVWAGTSLAFSCDEKARDLCLEGLANGHFDALETVWEKSVFKLPLEHCECPDHLANIDIADRMIEEVPEVLRKGYEFGAQQPRKHRAVIARFGRHSHRNAILGRASTPEELAHIADGVFPHETNMTDWNIT